MIADWLTKGDDIVSDSFRIVQVWADWTLLYQGEGCYQLIQFDNQANQEIFEFNFPTEDDRGAVDSSAKVIKSREELQPTFHMDTFRADQDSLSDSMGEGTDAHS